MRSLRRILLLPVLLVSTDLLPATEPGLRAVSLRGIQAGATTTLVIDGDDLGKNPTLLLPFAAKVALKPGNTDKQATFEVTPEATVTPGYHHLRVVTEEGVSLPTLIAVDALPQRPFGPAIESLPVALHGNASGSVPIETKFVGKKGGKIRIEVEAQRLGGKLRPVVHLIGPSQREVAWSWPNPALGDDTRLEATLPDDGEYRISLHDSEYAGANPGFFRMRVGEWANVHLVFPAFVNKGKQTVDLLTSRGVEKVEITAKPGAGVVPLAWPSAGAWSGPRPFVRVSSSPELVEQNAGEKGQPLPAGTVAISGRLTTPYEEDRYLVPVKEGDKLKLEVECERFGSVVDAAIVVRNLMGAEIARGEDGPETLDPVLTYTVPAKTESILICVADAQGRGGPGEAYRLSITPQPARRSELQLLTAGQRLSIPLQGTAVHPVSVERNGYTGPIELRAQGLPTGITLENTTIPPEADGALVTLRRGDAPAPPTIVTWEGKSAGGEESTVLVKGHPLERLQPWLATEVAVAPTQERGNEFAIDYRGLSGDVGLVPTGKLALPFQLTRPMSKSVVRVTLMTSQLGPLATPPENPNNLLRLEKAIEVPAAMNQGEASVIVPPTLTAPVYDLTLKAELLSENKQKVLATAYAPVRRLPLKLPLVLESKPRWEIKRDAKANATLEITGKVDRREGATGDVQLTLSGLPAGVPAIPVTTIKGDTGTFALKLTIPPNVSPGETTLKLSGTIAPDPKQANVRVRSREVELTLVVQ